MLAPIEVRPDVYWVGSIDWNERNFHGYSTDFGSTYNAYLIVDEKVVLIDAVKHTFADELIERISSVIDPARIDYIVSNHTEMDHSGSIDRVCKLAPNAKIIASTKAVDALKAHFGDTLNEVIPVANGETLSIGKRTLSFYHTPMVHWPESMLTYCEYDKIAFTMDAFGQHFATSSRFDDEVDLGEMLHQAKKYYANIVMPYGPQVVRALAALKPLDIEIIAPSHGVIWRSHTDKILDLYDKWANNRLSNYAIIVYDSMWHSTETMAIRILDAFMELGIPARAFDLKVNHISDIITETLDAQYVAVGSPTLNSNLMPTVASFLTYVKGLTPRNRHAYAMAFGSYGWGGQSIGQVAESLKECQMDLSLGEYRCQWVPTDEYLNEFKATVMERIKEAQSRRESEAAE